MEYEKKEGLYLTKNEEATPENKQPLLRLSFITKEGKFINLAGFWKTKSGKGYAGKIDPLATIKFDEPDPAVAAFDKDDI